jgi:hypothetical protein
LICCGAVRDAFRVGNASSTLSLVLGNRGSGTAMAARHLFSLLLNAQPFLPPFVVNVQIGMGIVGMLFRHLVI